MVILGWTDRVADRVTHHADGICALFRARICAKGPRRCIEAVACHLAVWLFALGAVLSGSVMNNQTRMWAERVDHGGEGTIFPFRGLVSYAQMMLTGADISYMDIHCDRH